MCSSDHLESNLNYLLRLNFRTATTYLPRQGGIIDTGSCLSYHMVTNQRIISDDYLNSERNDGTITITC